MYISDLYEDELEISIKVKSHRINQNDELETILIIISSTAPHSRPENLKKVQAKKLVKSN